MSKLDDILDKFWPSTMAASQNTQKKLKAKAAIKDLMLELFDECNEGEIYYLDVVKLRQKVDKL